MQSDSLGVVWVGQRGQDWESLAGFASLRGLICCDYSSVVQGLFCSTPGISIELAEGTRTLWANASLARLDVGEVAKVLITITSTDPLVIVPYRSQGWLEDLRNRLLPDVPLASAPANIVATLDDKVTQRGLFDSWRIPTPPWTVARQKQATWTLDEPSSGLWPAVAQHRRGSLGLSTFKLDNAHSWASLAPFLVNEQELVVSSYLEGPVVNVTAVVSKDWIHVGPPSIQLAGELACGADDESPFVYCGNDFTAAASLPRRYRTDVHGLTEHIARGLLELGFRGLFGVDYIASPAGVVALELNPRFQGSTRLLSRVETAAGLPASVGAHLAAFTRPDMTRWPSPFGEPRVAGAELVLYATSTGVSTGSPLHLPSGVTHSGFPVAGTNVLRGAVLGRLQTQNAILDDHFRLRSATGELAVLVRRRALSRAPMDS